MQTWATSTWIPATNTEFTKVCLWSRPDPRSDVFGKAEQQLGKQHMSLRSACTGCYQVEKGFWAPVKRLHPLIGWLQGACMCSTVFVGVSHLPLLKVAGEKLAGYLAEDSPWWDFNQQSRCPVDIIDEQFQLCLVLFFVFFLFSFFFNLFI